LANFIFIAIIYATIYASIKVEKRFTPEPSRDRSGNPFLRNEKKIAANSPELMFNKVMQLLLPK
jgi:hypothetical protein